MCGFVALALPGRRTPDPALVEQLADRLAHRGPDGRGTFTGPGVGLGHRRLAVIDVAGGHQPLHGADPRVVVAFNGEVFNYRAVRDQLPGPWRTESDTEVFLRAYEARGVAGLDDMVGMWGAAIWDGRSERLVVVRDRLGIKPVYYAELSGGGVAFASELRALLALEGIDREIDLDALEQLMTYRYVPAPRTLLRNIRKLRPGEVVTVEEGQLRAERYWQPRPQPDPISDVDAEDRFLALFDQAMDDHLVSDVPVGLFLSGGVDSTALLQSMDPGTHCFTIGFEGATRDNEIPLAAETCARFGGHHHATIVGAQDYIDTFDDYIVKLEEPVLNDSALATYLLSALARGHVKVALSGQGADEPLAGYDRFKGEALAPWWQAVRLPSIPGAWISRAPLSEKLKRAAYAMSEPDPLARSVRIYSVLQEDEKAVLFRPEVRRTERLEEPVRALHEEARHLSPLGRMLYTDTRLWLPDDLLLVADKLSMAHGLELRVPFLDHRIVELLERLPDAQKLRWSRGGFVTKAVHRRAMARRLSKVVLKRPKRGFDNPMSEWLRGPMRPMVEERLLDAGSPVNEWFRPDAVRTLLARHNSGSHDLRRAVFLLLSLDAWSRKVRDNAL